MTTRFVHEEPSQVVPFLYHVPPTVRHGGSRQPPDPGRDDAGGHSLGVGVDSAERQSGPHQAVSLAIAARVSLRIFASSSAPRASLGSLTGPIEKPVSAWAILIA